MNPDDLRVLVDRRMLEADETLEDARALVARGRTGRSVVNRADYAAFYAVLALLQTIGKTPRKHQGAITFLDSDFVRTGLLPKSDSDAVHELFRLRMLGDYVRLDPIPSDDVARAVGLADGFIASARAYLIRTGYLPQRDPA